MGGVYSLDSFLKNKRFNFNTSSYEITPQEFGRQFNPILRISGRIQRWMK